MAKALHNNRAFTLKQLCALDGKELLQWKYNKVVFQSLSKEWLVTWTLTHQSVFSQVPRIIHHLLREHPMEILAVQEEGAAELLKEARVDRGTIGILFEIWRKVSWDKVNGIESRVPSTKLSNRGTNPHSCQVAI